MKAKTSKRKKGALFLCGIGIERPADASIRTVQILKGCDVIFYVHGDGAALKGFFDAFCADVRIYDGSAFDGMDDRRKVAFVGKDVCRELARGRTVGYATYGHPMLFSDGFNMAIYCRSKGYEGRFIPAVSSLDSIMAALPEPVNLFRRGYQVCLGDQVLDPVDFFLPNGTLVLLGMDRIVREGRFKEFCARLASHYPADHVVYGIRCGSGEERDVILTGSVGKLRDWDAEIIHMMSLVLPGLGKS